MIKMISRSLMISGMIFAIDGPLFAQPIDDQSDNQILYEMQQREERLQQQINNLRNDLQLLQHQFQKLAKISGSSADRGPKNKKRAAVTGQKKSMQSLRKPAQSGRSYFENEDQNKLNIDQDELTIYNEAQSHIKSGNYKQARHLLTRFTHDYSNSPMVVNAYYWLGEMANEESDFRQAAIHYGEAYETYEVNRKTKLGKKISSKMPEVMLKFAKALIHIGEKKDAKIIITQLESEFKTLPRHVQQQLSLIKRDVERA